MERRRRRVINKGRFSVLGVRIHAVDYEAAVAEILAAARESRRFTVSALAVHGVMTGALDPTQRHRLNNLDLVVPDGQPVRWALRWLHGIRLPDRVYGPNLTLRVLERAADEGHRVFLYGSVDRTLERLERQLLSRLPQLRIVGREPSKFRALTDEEVAATVDRINATGARIVLVGLGCPRQEVFAYEMGDAINVPLLAVGAAFDFHAGTVRQAPASLQRIGLEWAFRLWQEPRRLWRRYVYLNPLFLCGLVLQRLRLLLFFQGPSVAPTAPKRFG